MKGEDLRTLPPAVPRGTPITIDLDGHPVRAMAGEPVAVALFAEGIRLLARSPKYHRPRGLFCASGHCGSCLMRIDGRPNVRACVTPARQDLRCERQNAFPDPEIDLLAAADWLFPGGMDHHKLMTGSRLGNELFVKLVRQMGGSGLLPDQPAAARTPARDETVDLCVVGAGPAGLTAARVVAEGCPGRSVLVVDENTRPGGSLLAEPDGVPRADGLARAAETKGVRLWTQAAAIGIYRDIEENAGAADPTLAPGRLAIVTRDGLVRLRARRFLYTTGAYDQNLPIADNDRPGVLTARAVGRLAFLWGVKPGRRLIVVPGPKPQPPYVDRLVAALRAHGVEVVYSEEVAAPPGAEKLDLRRDVVAVAALPAPASELARQHGGAVELDPARGGFCVRRADDGRAAEGILVAGDVCGYAGPELAAADGARVGAALVKAWGASASGTRG